MATNLTYTLCGDYYIPDIKLSEAVEQKPLGKYGRMRKTYLKEHRSLLWNSMILSESLYPHLREIDETANRRMEQIMSELIKQNGVTEDLKASDQMTWVKALNRAKRETQGYKLERSKQRDDDELEL